MNIQQLFTSLKTETAGNPENVEARKTKEGRPYIFIDDFVIHSDDGGYSVKDTREEMESFTTSGENVVEFFKGFYDACTSEYDEESSNEFYDMGYNVSMDATGDDQNFDGEEDEDESETEEFDENEHEDSEDK